MHYDTSPSNILIAKCNFCGAMNCIAHKKYTDRCVDCGKRYTKYSNYKSLQKSAPTFKRAKLLLTIVEEYENLEQQGHRVPRDIHQVKDIL